MEERLRLIPFVVLSTGFLVAALGAATVLGGVWGVCLYATVWLALIQLPSGSGLAKLVPALVFTVFLILVFKLAVMEWDDFHPLRRLDPFGLLDRPAATDQPG